MTDLASSRVGRWLLCAVLSLLCSANVFAQYATQPAFVQPSTQWGGVVVQPTVPHQPSHLLFEPVDPAAPVLLDQTLANDPVCCPLPPTEHLVPVQPSQPQLPPGTRKGVFQKLFFTGTWLPRFEDDSLGVSNLQGGVVLGFPFFRPNTPLLVTPRFGVNYLDGPTTPDLPARLYDAEVEFRHLRKFGEGPWAMDAAVSVGYYSDFEQGSSDAVRVNGRAIAAYERKPGTKWLLGVVYVNRAGLRVFPVVGAIIENPEAGRRWDLLFPRPKVSWRLPGGIPGSGDERWVYVGGEFGGGIWTIENPATLLEDELTYSDVRVLAGYERKIIGGISQRFEVGYVFARDLEFKSAGSELSLDDTLFLRAGLKY